MKILLDPQIFNEQLFGGISRYHTEVLRILKQEKAAITCPLYYTDNYHLLNYKMGKFHALSKFKSPVFDWLKKKLLAKNLSQTLNLLKKGSMDIFVPTYYNPYFLNAIGDTPFVLTVYDMIHELFPNYFSSEAHLIENKKLLIEKAKKVIAISKSTKNDIIKLYPHVDPDKIEVVYLNHSITNTEQQLPPSVDELSPYILFVGNRGLYKNFDWFVKSIAEWLKDTDISLICLGGGPFSVDEKEIIDTLKIKEKIIQYTFSDDELGSFYSNALAFVFPSAYEGFGIPVLEAMACDCPVIVPRVSSLPEVAGDAGIYFDLNKPESLVGVLNELLNNQLFREQTVEKGRLQISLFSWEKTCDGCVKVYEDAVS